MKNRATNDAAWYQFRVWLEYFGRKYGKATKNILRIGLSTAGHTGTFGHEPINALGELTSTLTGVILLEQVDSLNKESPVTSVRIDGESVKQPDR